ncbi:fibronectin type III domain-containing protein [Bacillus cereus]|uniref:fibronectin type III domain-containing protein n=1 Tax=Bacillus cereus TaxID=1396 RepID=UPI0015D46E80|nr:fibronectin type III domain-containing protein [Bacillus cereus]
MKFKKCGFSLSLIMLICFVLPSFASAEVVRKTDSYTKWYTKSYSPEATFNGKTEGTSYLYGKEVIADLGAEYSVKYVDYYAQGGVDGGYISFYDVNFRFISNFDLKLYGYTGKINVNKKARYVSVGHSTRSNPNSLNVSRLDVYIDDGKVSNVKDLKASLDGGKVKLSWVNPEGEDNFTGVKIYQDNKNIATLDKTATSYVVGDLKLSTKYTFKVTSLDTSKIETSGITTSIETSTPTLDPPNRVSLVSQDKSLIISWDDVKSPYFKGYNVYIDGKKVNSELLRSSKLNVKGLENGKSYKVQVATVNTKGVEGAKSKEVSESPSANALTVEYDVKMPFSPLDLLTSSVSLLAILGGFVLLSIAIIWFRPLKELIVKTVRREKDKK